MDFVSSHIYAKLLEEQNATALEAAKLQAQSVDKQIAAQKDANAEQQAYNKQEAELAFKRNSSKGQLQQLMDAGLSEMQARQIIAGGSAGSYTASPSVNEMSGVDYTAQGNAQAAQTLAQNQVDTTSLQQGALIWDNSLFGRTLSTLENGLPNSLLRLTEGAISSSLSSADGGIIGAYAAQPIVGQVASHINELQPNHRSYNGLMSLASSAAAPAWMKTADFQKSLDSIKSNPMAVRSLQKFFDTSNQLLTGDIAFEAKAQDLRNQQSIERLNVVTETYKKRSLDLLASQIANTDADTDLVNQKINTEKLEQRQLLASCISQEMQNKLFKDQLPYITDATIAELSYMTSEIALKDNWLYEHSDLFLEEMTKTAEGRCAAAALAAMNDEGTLKRIQESSTLKWLVELHNGLKGAGFQIINSTSAAAGATGLLMKAIKVIPK